MKKEKEKKEESSQAKVEEANIEIENKKEKVNKEAEYLEMAQRLQADFENYRRHVGDQLLKAKEDGKISVISTFLPCLDGFKEAKKSIKDEQTLKGVEMLENKILNALKGLGVEKVESIGTTYDPKVHEAIACISDKNYENDIILEEFQAGYKFNDKIIRYAKVIVNKKED